MVILAETEPGDPAVGPPPRVAVAGRAGAGPAQYSSHSVVVMMLVKGAVELGS